MSAKSFLTLAEASEEIGLSRDTLKAAIYEGRLKAKKTGKGGGGRVLIRRADLESFFDGMADA